MKRALLLCLFLLGCGQSAPDPCQSSSGSCVSLVLSSKLPLKIDRLRIYAFGAVKSSMSTAASLPIGVALLPPSGVSGLQTVTVEALQADLLVGRGSGSVDFAGRPHATMVLEAPEADFCPEGYRDCTGEDGCQTHIATAVDHCGECNHPCAYSKGIAACEAGACVLRSCETGYLDCNASNSDGCEVNLENDPMHCGDCKTVCGLASVCQKGRCVSNVVNCLSPGVTCPQSGCSSNRFAVSPGIAIDTGNGRVLWSRMVQQPATLAAATSSCASLSLEGIGSWRLPSYDELKLLLQSPGGASGCPTCNPAIDQAAFGDTPMGDKEWTSTVVNAGESYYLVDFCSGTMTVAAPTAMHPYRCIHDPL